MNLFNVDSELRHSGSFVLTEMPNYRSRAQGMVMNQGASTVTMPAGLVLASAGHQNAVATPAAGNVGNGVLTGLDFGPTSIPGSFKIRFSSATMFSVTSPTGEVLAASGVAGVAFSSPLLDFTVPIGSVPWSAGDTIILTPPSDLAFVPWVNVAAASGVLFSTQVVAAGASAKATIVNSLAEVRMAYLAFDPSMSGSTSPSFADLQVIAQQQLAAVGVLAR